MRGSRLPLIWEQTTNLGDWYSRLSFLTFLSVWKRRSPRGVIVRGSAGIWQRGGLESSPMLAPIQQASFPRALELSLSRALNGFTKLITSFSAFLKEPKATQVQTSRGSPLSR